MNEPIPKNTGQPTRVLPIERGEERPKFGRLLLVLLIAVLVIVVVTFVSEAYYM